MEIIFTLSGLLLFVYAIVAVKTKDDITYRSLVREHSYPIRDVLKHNLPALNKYVKNWKRLLVIVFSVVMLLFAVTLLGNDFSVKNSLLLTACMGLDALKILLLLVVLYIGCGVFVFQAIINGRVEKRLLYNVDKKEAFYGCVYWISWILSLVVALITLALTVTPLFLIAYMVTFCEK